MVDLFLDQPTTLMSFHVVFERIRSDAATTAAALTLNLPGTGQSRWRVRVEGGTYPRPTDVPLAGGAVISPGFFETFGIPVVEGRDFLLSESESGGEPVAIVSEGFVERHMGGGSALGLRIRLGAAMNGSDPWMRIVGVVPDTYQGMGQFGSDEIEMWSIEPQDAPYHGARVGCPRYRQR